MPVAYQAIYRKWRPTVFEDVIGQTHITDTLKNEIINNRVAHAYLFCGTRGTGKTTTAKIFSRAVNCEQPEKDGNPCNKCAGCMGSMSGTAIDIIEIDAASNNGVDDVRRLREEIVYTPASVKYKVYIIDEVHMLSSGAFNALLKTLEEPPMHIIFILATTEPHKIPATIQSRCQRFDFFRIPTRLIAGRVSEIVRKEGLKIAPDAIKLVASLGDGSMRDALSILDLCSGKAGEITKEYIEKLTGMAGSKIVFETAASLIDGNLSKAIADAGKAIHTGREVGFFAEEMQSCFREVLICKISTEAGSILDKAQEDIEKCMELADKATEEMLIHAIKTFADTIAVCKWAANPRVMFEAALVKICNPEFDSTSEAFAARIKNLESALLLGDFSNVQQTKPEQGAKPGKTDGSAVIKQKAQGKAKTDDAENTGAKSDKDIADIKATDNWTQIVNAVRNQDAASAALLDNTKCEIRNDVKYIIFDNATVKNLAGKNENLIGLLKKSAGGMALKFVAKGELEKKQDGKEKADPIDDLLLKKADLGDQMTII